MSFAAMPCCSASRTTALTDSVVRSFSATTPSSGTRIFPAVKWRAARMRMEYLLTPIQKAAENNKSKQAQPSEAQPKEAANNGEENKRGKDNRSDKEEKRTEATTKSDASVNAETPPDQSQSAGNGAAQQNEKKDTASKQSA